MHHIFIIYLFIEVNLGCFYILVVVNRTATAVNLGEQVSMEENVQSSGHVAKNIIARLHCLFSFNFLRILHVDFHEGGISFQSQS